MNIIVIGCGKVGSSLVEGLMEENHRISVIDINPEAFDKLPEEFEGTVVEGCGFDEETLIRAGISEADACAIVTDNDNANIMAAEVARLRFNIHKVIARIFDPEIAQFFSEEGITTICPTTISAEQVKTEILKED